MFDFNDWCLLNLHFNRAFLGLSSLIFISTVIFVAHDCTTGNNSSKSFWACDPLIRKLLFVLQVLAVSIASFLLDYFCTTLTTSLTIWRALPLVCVFFVVQFVSSICFFLVFLLLLQMLLYYNILLNYFLFPS